MRDSTVLSICFKKYLQIEYLTTLDYALSTFSLMIELAFLRVLYLWYWKQNKQIKEK